MLLTKEQFKIVDRKLNQIMEILKRAERIETKVKRVEVGFRLSDGNRIYITGLSVEDCRQRLRLADLVDTNVLSVEDVES